MLTPHQIDRLNLLTSTKSHYYIDTKFYTPSLNWVYSFNNNIFYKSIGYNNRNGHPFKDIFLPELYYEVNVVSFLRYRDWIISTNELC